MFGMPFSCIRLSSEFTTKVGSFIEIAPIRKKKIPIPLQTKPSSSEHRERPVATRPVGLCPSYSVSVL